MSHFLYYFENVEILGIGFCTMNHDLSALYEKQPAVHQHRYNESRERTLFTYFPIA